MTATKIGDLVGAVKTWNPSRSPEAEFEYIDLGAVDNGSKAVVAPTTVTGAEAPSRARQLVAAGDVLVSTVRPNLNAVAVVPPELDGATASTGFTVLRPSRKLDGRFLFHWVQSPAFIRDMVRKATGASYPAVSDRIIKGSAIPTPPLPEQRRIAAILDHAEALRTKRRQALAHLDSLTQSIFQDMFGHLPPNTTVGEVATIQGGLQVSSKREGLPVEAPYLRVANAHRGRLDLTEVKAIRATEAEIQRTALAEGDLLFVEGHANPLEVGRVSMWEGQIPGCVHQNHLIRGRFDSAQVLPIVAMTWLNTSKGARHFRRAGRTTSGLNTISASTVRLAPLLAPPIATQLEFAERVDRVNAQRDVVQRALDADEELFASIQSRAFRMGAQTDAG